MSLELSARFRCDIAFSKARSMQVPVNSAAAFPPTRPPSPSSLQPRLTHLRLLVVSVLVILSTYGAAAQSPAIALHTTPNRSTVVDGSDAVLDAVRWVTVTPAGDVLVNSAGNYAVQVFASTNDQRPPFGRRGEGPGEFRSADIVGWTGDSLWIGDSGLRRTSFFDSHYRYLGQIVWPVELQPAPLVSPSGKPIQFPIFPRAWHGNTFLTLVGAYGQARIADLPPDSRAVAAMVRVSAKNGTMMTRIPLLNASNRSCSKVIGEGNGRLTITVPFCPTFASNFSDDGQLFAWLTQTDRDEAVGQYHLLLLGSDGAALIDRMITTERELIPENIRREKVDAVLRSIARYRPGLAPPAIDVPRHFPTADALFVARDSTVWVRLPQTRRDIAIWQILRPGRSRISAWVGGATFRAFAVRNRSLYGVETTDDGVESIVRYDFSEDW